MADLSPLPVIEPVTRPSVADQVFDALHAQVLSLDLPPGARLSEVEVARAMGVSRQPVRDAFYRLSKQGFLVIRPQRATVVSPISAAAVLRASFLRTALELETMRAASQTLTDGDLAALEAVLADQRAAVEAADRPRFHALDDRFHMEICRRAGLGFVWETICDTKGHMDRVRMLSLSFGSRRAYDDHVAILSALRARDGEAAADRLRTHLARIREQIDRIRADNHAWFAEED